MKTQLAEIVGRRISAVYFISGPSGPKDQVMLVFDDGTHYELYAESLGTTAGVQWGGCEEVEAEAAWEKRTIRLKCDQPDPKEPYIPPKPQLMRLTDVKVRVFDRNQTP